MDYSEIPYTKISGSGRVTLPGYGTLRISGSGRVSPDEIHTSGSSHIPGGLKVRELHTSGSTDIDGDISAEDIRFSGSARIDGTLKCINIEKSGSMFVRSGLECEYGHFSGSTSIYGKAFAEEELRTSGSTYFGDNLESQGNVRFSGVIEVRGKVNSKTFEGRLSKDMSRIYDGVEAEIVDIQLSRHDWYNTGTLETKDIVGRRSVVLENIECDNVTGGDVRIMKGCRIRGKIRYTGLLEVDPSVRLESEPEKIE